MGAEQGGATVREGKAVSPIRNAVREARINVSGSRASGVRLPAATKAHNRQHGLDLLNKLDPDASFSSEPERLKLDVLYFRAMILMRLGQKVDALKAFEICTKTHKRVNLSDPHYGSRYAEYLHDTAQLLRTTDLQKALEYAIRADRN